MYEAEFLRPEPPIPALPQETETILADAAASDRPHVTRWYKPCGGR